MKNTLLAFLALTVSGCSTIFTGTSDRISFNSEPKNAKIIINGLERGKTPSTIRVKRDLNETFVILKKQGYEDKTIVLEQKFSSISVLNLFNVIAWAIDLATGSAMKYSIKNYDAELEKKETYHSKDSDMTMDGRDKAAPFKKEWVFIDKESNISLIVSKN